MAKAKERCLEGVVTHTLHSCLMRAGEGRIKRSGPGERDRLGDSGKCGIKMLSYFHNIIKNVDFKRGGDSFVSGARPGLRAAPPLQFTGYVYEKDFVFCSNYLVTNL